jgi:possible pathogenicity island protein
MNKEKIKLDLLKLIKNQEHTTFMDIEQYFDTIGFNYHGITEIVTVNHNVILWNNWNIEAIKIVNELLECNLITMFKTHEELYIIEGLCTGIPVYQGKKPYKQWLPVEFN